MTVKTKYKNPVVKFKQTGQNLNISVKIGRKKAETMSMRLTDKDERNVTKDKIKNLISSISTTGSELVATKKLKTLNNLFTKHASAKKLELDNKKVKAKATIKKTKKSTKLLKSKGTITKALSSGKKEKVDKIVKNKSVAKTTTSVARSYGRETYRR